jgi:hypothetical protein
VLDIVEHFLIQEYIRNSDTLINRTSGKNIEPPFVKIPDGLLLLRYSGLYLVMLSVTAPAPDP